MECKAEINVDVYETLLQATSQDDKILKPAEQKLRNWETEPGFYAALCKIISQKTPDISIRWLATVCLKNGIDKYWRKTATNRITEEEKTVVREMLEKCTDETHDAIAVQLAVIISKIARMEWSREWPTLIDVLMRNIQNNDGGIHRYRSLLILMHVVKVLSKKKLLGDKNLFKELTVVLFPIMLQFWNFSVQEMMTLYSDQEKNMVQYKYNMESSLYSVKILAKMTVHGFGKPHSAPDAVKFLESIFERIKTLLQFRNSTQQVMSVNLQQILEKHILVLVKALYAVLETHPFSFIDFVDTTLQCCYYYCFTHEGHDLVFESLLIRFLNLMKTILRCSEYKISPSKDMVYDDQIKKVKQVKDTFFSSDIGHTICYKLINEYFILNEQDLTFWDSDPEGYAVEEIGENWKYNLRPCVENLFSALLNQYQEFIIPALKSVIENNKISPDPNDMTAILKKDAVYNAMGLAVFDLFDDIDFDKWMTEILLRELHVKTPYYRILRKRIAWLIGRWTGVKLSAQYRPILYSEMIELLVPTEDIAVRLTVASTIKDIMDDFEFRTEAFLEHIPKCFQALYTLLEQCKECDTKLQVLTVLSFIIERIGWEIAPYFDSLVNYLPLLWQHSQDHNMLRCAIVSVLTQIVGGLGNHSSSIENFIIPVIEYSLDVKQDGHVYLQEDGLSLLLCYIENVKNSDDVFSVIHFLPSILECSTEYLKTIVNIYRALLLLSPDKFITEYAKGAIQSLNELLTDIKTDGINWILQFFEACIVIRPYPSIKLLESFLRDNLLAICTKHDDKMATSSLRISIIARIVLLSNEIFGQLIEDTSRKFNASGDMLFEQLIDSWLGIANLVWPLERKKLTGLALSNLLTSGSSAILSRFNKVVNGIMEVLNDILVIDNDVYADSLLFNDDRSNLSESSDSDEPNQKTEHEIRLAEMRNDPIYKVDLLWYFQKQLSELQTRVGDVYFQQLMSSVTEDVINQLKVYVKK